MQPHRTDTDEMISVDDQPDGVEDNRYDWGTLRR